MKVGGVRTATSNPQPRARAGGLFGFGGPNRFGGGLDKRERVFQDDNRSGMSPVNNRR